MEFVSQTQLNKHIRTIHLTTVPQCPSALADPTGLRPLAPHPPKPEWKVQDSLWILRQIENTHHLPSVELYT